MLSIVCCPHFSPRTVDPASPLKAMGLFRCLSPAASQGPCLNRVDALIFPNSCLPGSPARPARAAAGARARARQSYVRCPLPPGPNQPTVGYKPSPGTARNSIVHTDQWDWLKLESVPTLGRMHLFRHSKPKSHLLWCTQKPSQGELQMSARVMSSKERELMCLCAGMQWKGTCRLATP